MLSLEIDDLASSAGTASLADRGVCDPHDLAAHHELEEALAHELGKLTVAQRGAVELKSLGYSLEEIAEALGTSPSNAGVLVHRGARSWPSGWRGFWRIRPMNPTDPPAESDVERLVRAGLDRSAEKIDPTAFREDHSKPGRSVKRASSGGKVSPSRHRNRLEMGGGRRGGHGRLDRVRRAHARANGAGQGRDGRPRGGIGPTSCPSTAATSWRSSESHRSSPS